MSMHAGKKLKQALDEYVAANGEPKYLCAVVDFQRHHNLQPGDNVVIGLYHEAPDTVRAFYFRNKAKTLEFAGQGDIETLAQLEFSPEQEKDFTGKKPSLAEIVKSPKVHISCMVKRDELWSYLDNTPEVHDITWLF